MTCLLPSLLTLTFGLELPSISQLTGSALSARVMDREHAVMTTARLLQDKLRPLPVLFCRMIRPHIIPNDEAYCYTVHILQIDAIRCRRIGSASKAWMHMVLVTAQGEGCIRAQSFPTTALDRNVSCTMHFDEDHTDVKTDVSIADLMHVQKFQRPVSLPCSTAE